MIARIRLRTALVLVVVLAVGFAFLGNTWRRGEFQYQKRHALLASRWEFEAEQLRHHLKILRNHGEHGPACWRCRMRTKPLKQLIEEAENKLRIADEQVKYYSRIAGEAAMKPYHPDWSA